MNKQPLPEHWTHSWDKQALADVEAKWLETIKQYKERNNETGTFGKPNKED